VNRDAAVSEKELLEGIPLEFINEYRLLSFFAGQLVDWRIKHGKTQSDLGKKLDMSQSMVSKYENMSENPSVKTIAEILSKLGLVIAYPSCDAFKTTGVLEFPIPKGSDPFLEGFNSGKSQQLASAPFEKTNDGWSGSYLEAV
jgi:transcriptional regulator with XRE-family HTH domain